MVSGIVTAVFLALFIAMCFWAFSPRRKRDFDAAARLPLSDDPPATDDGKQTENEQ